MNFSHIPTDSWYRCDGSIQLTCQYFKTCGVRTARIIYGNETIHTLPQICKHGGLLKIDTTIQTVTDSAKAITCFCDNHTITGTGHGFLLNAHLKGKKTFTGKAKIT